MKRIYLLAFALGMMLAAGSVQAQKKVVDKIIEAAFVGEGWQPWVFGLTALVGAGLTAFYMSRLFFLTFHGKARWTDDQQHFNARHEGLRQGQHDEQEYAGQEHQPSPELVGQPAAQQGADCGDLTSVLDDKYDLEKDSK